MNSSVEERNGGPGHGRVVDQHLGSILELSQKSP